MYLKTFLLSVLSVIAIKNIFLLIDCLDPSAKSKLEEFVRLNVKVCDHNRNLNLDTSEVQFSYYDLQTGLRVKNKIGIAVDEIYPYLDPKKRLILFVPGLTSLEDGPTSLWMRDAFKEVTNINYMQVDFSAYTGQSDIEVKIYMGAVTHAYYIGNAIAEFLAALNDKGFNNKIQIVGHSLGGQIVGYVGDAYKGRTNRRIWRITGIDPSGPCFAAAPIQDQLRSGLADYVEVYHCSVNQLGTVNYLGDVDFLVNGGGIQPECMNAEVPESCSHMYCVKQWCLSVNDSTYYNLVYEYDGGINKDDRKVGYHTAGDLSGMLYVSTKTADAEK